MSRDLNHTDAVLVGIRNSEVVSADKLANLICSYLGCNSKVVEINKLVVNFLDQLDLNESFDCACLDFLDGLAREGISFDDDKEEQKDKKQSLIYTLRKFSSPVGSVEKVVNDIIIHGLNKEKSEKSNREKRRRIFLENVRVNFSTYFFLEVDNEQIEEELLTMFDDRFFKALENVSHISEVVAMIFPKVFNFIKKNNGIINNGNKDYLVELSHIIVGYLNLQPENGRFFELFIKYEEQVANLDLKRIWSLIVDDVSTLFEEFQNSNLANRNEGKVVDTKTFFGDPINDSDRNRFLRSYSSKPDELCVSSRMLVAHIALKIAKDKLKNDADNDDLQQFIDDIRHALFEEEFIDDDLITEIVQFIAENNINLSKNEILKFVDELDYSENNGMNLSELILSKNFQVAKSALVELKRGVKSKKIDSGAGFNFDNLEELIKAIKETKITNEESFKKKRDAIACLALVYTSITVRAKYSLDISFEATDNLVQKFILNSENFNYCTKNGEAYLEILGTGFKNVRLYIGQPKNLNSVIRKMLAKGLLLDGMDSVAIEKLVKDHCRFTVVVDDAVFNSKEVLLAAVKSILLKLIPEVGTDFHHDRTKFLYERGSKSNTHSTGERFSVNFTFENRFTRFNKGESSQILSVPTEVQIVPRSQFVVCESDPAYKDYSTERQEYEMKNKFSALKNIGFTTTWLEFFEQNVIRAVHGGFYEGVEDEDIEATLLRMDRELLERKVKEVSIEVVANEIQARANFEISSESSKYFSNIVDMLHGSDLNNLFAYIKTRVSTSRPGKIIEIYTKLHGKLNGLAQSMQNSNDLVEKNLAVRYSHAAKIINDALRQKETPSFTKSV